MNSTGKLQSCRCRLSKTTKNDRISQKKLLVART